MRINEKKLNNFFQDNRDNRVFGCIFSQFLIKNKNKNKEVE